MFDKFYPDIYARDIFSINYQKLKERNIKCLLFDLDNTIATVKQNTPSQKVKELLYNLEEQGFKVIIFSNSGKKRVGPFKEMLNVDASYSSMKPLPFKYKKILKIYKYKDNEIAAIGDQILTDVFGANCMNFTSILVNQISTNDFIWTKINRRIETFILNKFYQKGMWTKGEYYD